MKSVLPAIDYTSLFFMLKWSVHLLLYKTQFYKTLNIENRLKLGNRVVSTVHSIFAPIHTLTSLYFQGWKPFSKLSELSFYTIKSIHFSTGYFLWDVFASLEEGDPAFVLHAIACLGIFVMGCIDPNITMFILSFLLYELTTPFINIRWILLKMNPTRFKKWISRLEKIIFLLFFLLRIGVGLPIQCYFLKTHFSYFKKNPSVSGLGIILGNIGLGGLNMYWGGKMIHKFLKK